MHEERGRQREGGREREGKRRRRGVSDLEVLGDGVTKRVEESIKQLLDLVVNGGLDWQSRHCDAVYVNGAG